MRTVIARRERRAQAGAVDRVEIEACRALRGVAKARRELDAVVDGLHPGRIDRAGAHAKGVRVVAPPRAQRGLQVIQAVVPAQQARVLVAMVRPDVGQLVRIREIAVAEVRTERRLHEIDRRQRLRHARRGLPRAAVRME